MPIHYVEAKGLKDVEEFIAMCRRDFPVAVKYSINKAVDKSRTNAWREVKAKYTMKQEAFYKRYFRYKASNTHLTGKVFINSSPAVALHEFKTAISKKGVKVTIAKAGGAKLIPGSFHMRGMKNLPVFLRVHQRSGLVLNSIDPESAKKIPWKRLVQEGKLDSKARLPIRKLFSLSAAQVVDDGEILDKVLDSGATDFQAELTRQIDRMFG
jgi:hypothetical protein